MLLFFNVSFIIRQLDYIWHGFHFTNMIPYRFSFLYSFVLLYMAYRVWTLRKSLRLWQIIVATVLSLGLIVCSDSILPLFDLIAGKTTLLSWQENAVSNIETILKASYYLLYNLVFLLGYLTALCYELPPKPPRKQPKRRSSRKVKLDWLDSLHKKRRTSSVILLAIMGFELIMILANFGIRFSETDVSNYPKGTVDTEAVIDYMQQREADNLFYRAETTHSQTLNDGALNSYNGISAFTSSANVNVTDFMQALGYGAKDTYNRYCFEESSPVANLFLNLKYMIERDGIVKENSYFDDIYSSGKIHLLENNAYLPLGFLANAQLINTNFAAEGNRFAFQNSLIRDAAGISKDCFRMLSDNCITIYGSDLNLESQQTGYCNYVASTAGTVTYRCVADRNGLFCFYVEQSKRNNFSVYVNSSQTPIYTESYTLPQMLSVCDVQVGDVIEIKFTCKTGESGSININAAVLDEKIFRTAYEVLAASTLKLNEFKTNYVEGAISCNRNGVLYTSIPQDGNWTATVDGKPAQIVKIGGTMVGLNLSEGDHTVVFRYQNRAFSLGWKISLACLLVFTGLWFAIYQPHREHAKGKYQK
ncbi:MAG: YfhO family protein [Oscillospiraceae bacterium]|nr:YfhO family protein [Oscillospiraceae bacterium]